jgi:molybdopterin converting factor subunit 1
MRVKALYFSMLKDAMGLGEEWVEVPAASTAAALKARVLAVAPQAEGLLASLAVAVNQNYAAWDEALKEGDEVALLPPVAGG